MAFPSFLKRRRNKVEAEQIDLGKKRQRKKHIILG